MKRIFKSFSKTLALIVITVPLAANAFVIRNIQFYGLQHIPVATALSNVTLKQGETFTSANADATIRALFKSGLFSDVRISRRGDTVIITVAERPTISLVNIDGNKAIKYDDLKTVLKKIGVYAGQPYDSSKLHMIVVGLEDEYGQLGYHAVDVTDDVKNEPNNTVALYIHVHEGLIAKVHSINFVGNNAFSSRQLRDQFQLTTPGILTIFNHNDRYSKIKLDQDTERLKNFYLNHGYIHFAVTNTDVAYTADHKGVNITLTVSEGPLYHVSQTSLTGDLLGQHDAMQKLITLKPGDVFSRQKILDTRTAIRNFLANRGYANTDVQVASPLNENDRTVSLIFNVNPGGLVYVRRVNFYGNQRTTEEALRQETRQMEGGVYSQSNIDESTHRLKLLPYIDPFTLQQDTSPVPGKPDEVDINYHVKEKNSGKASVSVGYSDAYGFLYGASIAQPNFMGTGRFVSLGFQNSQVVQQYNFNYTNPYATTNGVSLNLDGYYSHSNFDPQFNFQTYVMDKLGFDWIYGFPISENNTVSLGFGYNNTNISHVNLSESQPSVVSFLNNQTNATFNILNLITGWTYDGRDQAIFPTDGWYEQLNGTVGVPWVSSSLSYYKVGNSIAGYIPLGTGGFVLNLVNWVGYGNGYGKDSAGLPFFLNYYAGGMGTVPGYESNSLGPKSTANGGALGGNFVLTGGVHLILPNMFHNKLRLAGTFDIGNVFQLPVNNADANSPNVTQDEPFEMQNLRMSAGVLVEWWTPLGAPIDLSLAFPLNRKQGDDPQEFQFSFGTSI